MTTYALIHGAWSATAHSQPLQDELRSRGHDVVAPELPIDDPQATFSDYAAVMDEALGDADDVVVLAKSMGGCSAPLLALRRPVRRIVFVAALLPQPGKPLAQVLREEPMLVPGHREGLEVDERHLQRWTDPAAAHERLWQDADPETSRRAFEALRPQAAGPYLEPCPELPDVPFDYVVCREDRIVSSDWAREAARRLLGVEALEIDGSHCPGLVRPAELADLLGA